MPRAPQIDTLTKMRFITNYLIQGCEAPFVVLIDHSVEPGLDLLLLYLTFDLDDFVKELFRPGPGRVGRHGRKGPKSGKKGGGIPDVSEGYAHKVRPAFDGIRPTNVAGLRSVYIISDIADSAQWTMAEIEGITDFGFDTLWGVINDKRARCPGMGRFLRTDDHFSGGLPHREWVGINVPVEHYAVGVTSSTGFGATVHEGKWVATFAANIRGAGVNGISGLKFALLGGPGNILVESGTFDLNPGDTSSVIIDTTINGIASFQWAAWSESGFYELTDVNVSAISVAI